MTWRRLLALTLAAIIAIAAVGVFAFKRQIGDHLYRRAIAETVGRDRAADLPDGIHVYVCGAGSPLPDPGRAGPCLAVLAGAHAFVFDAGAGSVRTLAAMGFPLSRIDRVYLTHLHSDHIDNLGELLLQAWIAGGRDTPLPVAGPQGVEEVVAGFNAAYRIDSGFRTAHHGADIADPNGFGGAPDIIPDPGESPALVFEEGDLKLFVISVAHAPVSPAFGYRLDYQGRSIAISGDTAYSARFAEASRGVDVMFHEALEPAYVAAMGEAARRAGQPALAKIMSDIPSYHTAPIDAARAAQAAAARQLVLYHIIPPLPSRFLHDAYIGDARSVYGGRIRIGEDGMLVSLPADSDAIRVTQALR